MLVITQSWFEKRIGFRNESQPTLIGHRAALNWIKLNALHLGR